MRYETIYSNFRQSKNTTVVFYICDIVTGK